MSQIYASSSTRLPAAARLAQGGLRRGSEKRRAFRGLVVWQEVGVGLAAQHQLFRHALKAPVTGLVQGSPPEGVRGVAGGLRSNQGGHEG